MCDYSLEMYRSTPARQGEEYVSSRFASGTIGFTAPGDPSVAVCMACDMALQLRNIPDQLREQHRLNQTERAVFARLAGTGHRDAVRFANGSVLTLQQLGAGVEATVIDALERKPAVKTPAKKEDHVAA